MRRGFVALAVVTGSLMAVSSAPAMASLHWSDTTHGINVSGSVTVSKPGFTSTTCTAPSKQQSSMIGTFGSIWNDTTHNSLDFSCTGGKVLQMSFGYLATSTTTLEIIGRGTNLLDPWESLYTSREKAVADFSNGSGATPSTVTFNNDEIGWDAGHNPIKLTGSLNVTTSTGGLLTLLP